MILSKKKPKYPIEFKKEVCEHAKDESIISASLVYNVDRNTISRWIKKYDQFGVNGFITKRNDTQKKKLDDKTLEKITQYKNKNPKATYLEIREQFNLNCSIPLISRKLKKVNIVKSDDIENNYLYLQFKIVHQIVVEGEIDSVYQLIIYSCQGKILSVGFTDKRDSFNICLFIRKSLDMLKKKPKFSKIKKIITNIKYLFTHEYNTIVRSVHKVNIEVSKDVNSKKLNKIICKYNSRDIQEIILESYKKYLTESDTSELKNFLTTPHMNIDKIGLIESDSGEWVSHQLPTENIKSLNKVLKDIERSGDKAVLDFDYEQAMEMYEKVYITLLEHDEDNKELQLDMLLKKAKLSYDSDQFQVAIMLYRDGITFAKRKRNGLKKELGITYYYLGMIYEIFHNKKGALRYFNNSEDTLRGLSLEDEKCIYYRTLVRKSLLIKNYNETTKFNKRFYKYAIKINDKAFIGNSLSNGGKIFYHIKDYNKSEIAFTKAKEYNIESENIHEACNNLSSLLNIYSFAIEKEYSTLEVLLNELKILSNKINKPYINFEANYKLGIFYYNKSEYDIAGKLLYRSLPGIKKYSDKELYLSNLYYLGRVLYADGKGRGAVRLLNLLVIEAVSADNLYYILYSYRILAKIFYEREDYKRSIEKFNKTIKFSKKLNEFYITADSHKYIAELSLKRKYDLKAESHFENSLKYFKLFNKKNKNSNILNEINYVKVKLSELQD